MNKALAEQAGGDERAAFERAFTVQEGIYFDDKRGEYRSMNLCAIEASDAHDLNLRLQGWQARAALAQPSPKPGELVVTRNEVGAIVAITRQDAEGRVLNVLAEAQPSTALELDYTHMSRRMLEELAKVGKCLVATADLERLTQERDAAQDRVAELEKQEPVAWMHDQPNRVDVIHRDVKDLLQRVPGSSRGIYRPLDVSEHYTIPLYAAPVAQAQHSVPEVSGIGRDTGHPRAVVLYLRKEPTDDDLRAIHDALRSLAAAPGKEVPQAWLDVQAERRRQITAEGWTPEHDDLYCAAELPRAAAAYILSGANDEAPAIWPFSAKWWKPRDARANYMRAGALILAEIERLDRAAAAGKEVGHE
ncbi:hypothetical protein PWN83_005954 [Pseudomonas aeruginosa]